MVATAFAATPTKLAVRYVHARAERLLFSDGVFDLVFATLSLRHWTNQAAGIAEVARVLTSSGWLSLPTSSAAVGTEVQRFTCCVVADTPLCRLSLTRCWPPTA